MKDHLNEIFESIPIRRTPEQKKALFEYIRSEAEEVSLEARTETLENKHNNIVVGDIEKADIVFTAHYDTPARSLFPNLMMPRNPALAMTYSLGIPVCIALLSLGIAYCISLFFGNDRIVWALLYVVLYFAMFFVIMIRVKNNNNKNDNTSGVAALLSIMSNNPKNTAYIFFDNEEKGLLGSKAYNKAHKELMENKFVINLDCVGNGDNIIFIAKPNAEKHRAYETLKNSVTDGEGYTVNFFPQKGSISNTDYKNFPTAVSVMACKKKNKIFYTPNIHTVKDTVAKSENIHFLSERLSSFAGENR